jgi:hypothetical protein
VPFTQVPLLRMTRHQGRLQAPARADDDLKRRVRRMRQAGEEAGAAVVRAVDIRIRSASRPGFVTCPDHLAVPTPRRQGNVGDTPPRKSDHEA